MWTMCACEFRVAEVVSLVSYCLCNYQCNCIKEAAFLLFFASATILDGRKLHVKLLLEIEGNHTAKCIAGE